MWPRSHIPDALRLVIYAIFFYTIFTLYGSIPLNHIHSLYSAVRSFSARIRDLLKYRMATKNMDAKYPDATEEDIRGMGGESCVICREEMVPGSGRVPGRREGPNDTPKKLGCGHVFHFHCLRSWLERQQSCPTWYELRVETSLCRFDKLTRMRLSSPVVVRYSLLLDLPDRHSRLQEASHQHLLLGLYRELPVPLDLPPRYQESSCRLGLLDLRQIFPVPNVLLTARLDSGRPLSESRLRGDGQEPKLLNLQAWVQGHQYRGRLSLLQLLYRVKRHKCLGLWADLVRTVPAGRAPKRGPIRFSLSSAQRGTTCRRRIRPLLS